MAALSVLYGALSLAACDKGEAQVQSPDGADGDLSAFDGARWVFHPLEKSETTDSTEHAGVRIEVDRAGSRWRIEEGRDPEVSPFGAPEPLTGILHAKGRYAAVGESGAVYFSREPLSAFEDVRTPPERFVTTQRVGTALLAISRSGQLFRSSDLGKHWEPVGPNRHFVELATSGDGTVLGLAVPEQWYRSTDGGRTFVLETYPPQAPRRIGRLDSGEIFVEGLHHTSLFRRGKFEPADRATLRSLFGRSSESQYALPPFARAAPVTSRRAALVGQAYLALKPSVAGRPWKLARGGLEEPIKKVEVGGLGRCASFLMVGAGKRTDVICQDANTGEVSPDLQIYRSVKWGSDYKPLDGAFRGPLGRVVAATSAHGDLALGGLCIVPEKGCSPSGVRLLPDEDEHQPRRVHVPGVPNPQALAFDTEGSLWAAGRRLKDGSHMLYGPVRGKVEPRLINLSQVAAFPRVPESERKTKFHLLPGSDGLLAVVVEYGRGARIALFDQEGELLGTGLAPSGTTSVHGAGRLLAALDPTEGVLWESTTGGLSWSRHELPRDLCTGPQSECQPRVVCSEAGCLVGDELSRIGWGSHDASARPELPFDAALDQAATAGLGYECTAADGQWIALPGLGEVPRAPHAALGEAAWAQALQDPSRSSITAIRVPFGESEIRRELLLPPLPVNSDYLFFVQPQVEGVAAVRFPRPRHRSRSSSLRGAQSPGTIEVAWDNRITGVFGQAAIDHPLAASVASPFGGLSLIRSGKPELLSVAGRGLYVRLAARGASAPTFFVTGRGKRAHVEELEEVRWPEDDATQEGWATDPSVRSSRQLERLRLDGQHAGLALYAGWRALAVTRGLLPSGKAESFSPYLLGLLDPDSAGYAQRTRISYLGEKVGMLSFHVNLDGPGHRAAFIPLDADTGVKAPRAVPLQQDLGEKMQPCSSSDRLSSPRVIAPGLPGLGRPVSVTGATQNALELVTDDAVLFGTPKEPCVAVFEAETRVRGASGQPRFSVLVVAGEGQTSWVFRTTPQPVSGATVSARPLTCRAEGETAR